MDIQQPENTGKRKSVLNIVHDFHRSSEKKAQRRENTLLSFAMKATARDQEKNMLISRLQRELAKSRGLLNLLEMENDINKKLLKENEEEIKTLRKENEMLRNATATNTRRASLNVEPLIAAGETPSKTDQFSNVVISTQGNIVASPSTGDNHDIVSSSKVESAGSHVDSSKPKAKISKRKSFKRSVKDGHVTSFFYNLRNMSKPKANEKMQGHD